jgi:hypothetical protein
MRQNRSNNRGKRQNVSRRKNKTTNKNNRGGRRKTESRRKTNKVKHYLNGAGNNATRQDQWKKFLNTAATRSNKKRQSKLEQDWLKRRAERAKLKNYQLAADLYFRRYGRYPMQGTKKDIVEMSNTIREHGMEVAEKEYLPLKKGWAITSAGKGAPKWGKADGTGDPDQYQYGLGVEDGHRVFYGTGEPRSIHEAEGEPVVIYWNATTRETSYYHPGYDEHIVN